MPPMIKCFTAIIKKDHCIDCTMNNQKEHKENAGQAHGDFFTYRGGVEVFPGHKKDVNFLEA